jgi:acyl-CoA synthetase (NDP forming)
VPHRLAPLFEFSSIAVVGASDTNHTGLGPYKALQTLGFKGSYYPVNPRREEVHGLKAYPSVRDLPDTPEMVVIAVPRDAVPEAIDQCAARGVKAAVICSAGFVEQDAHGAELQAHVTETARKSGLLVIGPNCFGVASIVNRCSGISAGLEGVRPGNVGVISNSGGLMNEIMFYGTARGIGFSHLVSSGNEAGVTAADVIDYYVDDSKTDVVLGIIETVRNPELFVQACDRALRACKPIVLVKMGSSEKGARSTTTHTGALAGSDAVYSALFKQKGVVRVNDIDELIDMGALFSTSVDVLRKHRLERTGIIEISGGGKGLVSDTAAAAGVELPDLPEATVAKLRGALPENIYATNPIDTEGSWGDATKPQVYPLLLETFGSEPELEVIISRYTVPRTGGLGPLKDRLEEMETARRAHPDKLFAVLSRTSDQFAEDWAEAVREQRIPFLQGYGRGLRAVGRLAEYSRKVHGARARRELESGAWELGIADRSQPATGLVLGEIESKQLLAASGIPVVETLAAAVAEDAVRVAQRLGLPVALKVIAPELVHKSDQGGVKLGLAGVEAVRQAFAELRDAARSAGATFQGVAVQPMAKPGLEIVLGAHRDAQFGAVVLFGLGGVFVEVLHDVALRVAPLTAHDAAAMLDEIRGSALLDGVRGQPAVDRVAICQALVKLAELMLSRPDIASIDVNPAFAYPQGLLAVDARVELTGSRP